MQKRKKMHVGPLSLETPASLFNKLARNEMEALIMKVEKMKNGNKKQNCFFHMLSQATIWTDSLRRKLDFEIQ